MKLVVQNFRIFMKKVWEVDKRYFLYILLYFISVAAFTYYTIQIPKIVLDMIETSKVDIDKIVGIFIILLVSALISSYSRVLFVPIGSKVRYRYLLNIFEQYISIPYEDYDNPKIQKDLWKIMRPVSSIDGIQAFYTNIALFVGNLGILCISIGILFQIQVWISALIFIWFIVYTYLSLRAANKVDKEYDKNIVLDREKWYLEDIAVDAAYGKEIRVFQLQSWLQNKCKVVYSKLNVMYKKNETLITMPEIYNDIYQFVRDGFIYGFLITMYFKNKITLGEFTSYSVLILQLNSALMAGSSSLRHILSRHENYQSMLDFIQIPKQSRQGKSIELKDDWEIKFEHVSFRYPETERWIYEDLNFSIKKGSKLAIVGLNGVGKTTLLKLILRLYQPTKGRITLNNVDISEYKLDDYFELFAPVFQEINIFPFTIRENLCFGKEIDNEKLIEALINAGLDMESLNNGELDSAHMTRYLHSDGINLSGGQSQKFVTARAFASKRPIYILDEPTSALDAIAEYDFYHQIDSNMKDKTVLFVSHRLASTQFCDEIILIENGRIVENGSHESLLQKNGRYNELFTIQAKYYQSEVVE